MWTDDGAVDNVVERSRAVDDLAPWSAGHGEAERTKGAG
jgi:hypothetical protein